MRNRIGVNTIIVSMCDNIYIGTWASLFNRWLPRRDALWIVLVTSLATCRTTTTGERRESSCCARVNGVPEYDPDPLVGANASPWWAFYFHFLWLTVGAGAHPTLLSYLVSTYYFLGWRACKIARALCWYWYLPAVLVPMYLWVCKNLRRNSRFSFGCLGSLWDLRIYDLVIMIIWN